MTAAHTLIRDQCVAAGAGFFFKQWDSVNKGKTGRTLAGRTWDEMPDENSTNASGRIALSDI